MPSIFLYEFMLRALAGGVLVGVLAPTLGVFIVLRRFSLIAETLAHVALMGVAIGLATNTFPSVVALVAASLGAILVEQRRSRGRLPGDALAGGGREFADTQTRPDDNQPETDRRAEILNAFHSVASDSNVS